MAVGRIDLWTVTLRSEEGPHSFLCEKCQSVTFEMPPCRPMSRPQAEEIAQLFNSIARANSYTEKFRAVPIPCNVDFVYCDEHAPPSVH